MERSPALEHETRPGARVQLVGAPGHTMLATTARVLHHACLVEPGRRRDIATFAFRPARRPLADDWHDEVLVSRVRNTAQNRGRRDAPPARRATEAELAFCRSERNAAGGDGSAAEFRRIPDSGH